MLKCYTQIFGVLVLKEYTPHGKLGYVQETLAVRGNFFESCFAIRDSFPRLFAVFITLFSSFMGYHKSITLYVSTM